MITSELLNSAVTEAGRATSGFPHPCVFHVNNDDLSFCHLPPIILPTHALLSIMDLLGGPGHEEIKARLGEE